MLEFCLDKNIVFFLNTVFWPEYLSLKHQSIEYLDEVINYLSKYDHRKIRGNFRTSENLSIGAYSDFIKQLKGWQAEKKKLRQEEIEKKIAESRVYEPINTLIGELKSAKWSVLAIGRSLDGIDRYRSDDRFSKHTEEIQTILGRLLIATPRAQLFDALLCYIDEGSMNDNAIRQKLSEVAEVINAYPRRDDVLGSMGNANRKSISAIVREYDVVVLKDKLTENFPLE
jgi:hypothetical protein